MRRRPAGSHPIGPRAARWTAPRAGVILAAVLVLAFVSVLLVNAYVSNEFVPDHRHRPGGNSTVPQQIIDGGPLVDTSSSQVRS